MEVQSEQKWHQKPSGIIILLILFFPIGLYLMWKNKHWSPTTRWVVTGVIVILLIASAGNENSSTSPSDSSSSNTSESTSDGPDICDCVVNAQMIGTAGFNEDLQNQCEIYSASLSESEKNNRVFEAIDRGCLK